MRVDPFCSFFTALSASCATLSLQRVPAVAAIRIPRRERSSLRDHVTVEKGPGSAMSEATIQSGPEPGTEPGLKPVLGSLPGRLWLRLIATHDRIFSSAHKNRLRSLVIRLSALGLVLHLLGIFLARNLSHPPLLLRGFGDNYLTAISTPFNIILFYEVLTLIAALPASTTRSIANQFEIVSLVFIRDVFKDIAHSPFVAGRMFTRQAMPLLIDMWAAMGMFLLVAVFQYVAVRRVPLLNSDERQRGLERFIQQKKVIAIGLTVLLLGIATWELGLLSWDGVQVLRTGHDAGLRPPAVFYSELFSVMIFTDVLILILSLNVSGAYEMVFRNAAFIVSIILIRFAMTESPPYNAPLALAAMLFGIVSLVIYNFHMRLLHDSGA
jgi:hypothetical protein